MKSRKPYWIDRSNPEEVAVRARGKDGQLVQGFSIKVHGEQAERLAKQLCHNLNKFKGPA